MIYFLLLSVATALHPIETARKHLRPFFDLEDEVKYKMISSELRFPYQAIPINDNMMFYKCQESGKLKFPKKFTEGSDQFTEFLIFRLPNVLISEGHVTFLEEFCRENKDWTNFEFAADNSRIVALNKQTKEAKGKRDAVEKSFLDNKYGELLNSRAEDFYPKDIKEAFLPKDVINGFAVFPNDNITKLLIQHGYPFTINDNSREKALLGWLDFHPEALEYERLFYALLNFENQFPKSLLQLAKMVKNVNKHLLLKAPLSLFQRAVQKQNVQVVSYMIKHREPNLSEEFLCFSMTGLCEGFRKNEVLEHELESPVNILWCALDNSKVTLEDAVAETFKVLVESLDNEQARAMINAPCGPNNQTCLHIAAERIYCRQMHFSTFKLLIKKGADVLLKNKNGNTAYDIAQKYINPKTINQEEKKIARYLRKKLKLAKKNRK